MASQTRSDCCHGMEPLTFPATEDLDLPISLARARQLRPAANM